MNATYELSGKTGNLWTIGLLIGLPLVLVIAWIYGNLLYYNPIVYLSVLLFIGYLIAIGIILRFVAFFGKCRNRLQAKILAMSIGVLALYISWVFFLKALMNDQLGVLSDVITFWFLLESPMVTFEMIRELNITGYYSIFGVEVKGLFLSLIWLIEAGGILFVAWRNGQSIVHEEVFCENCNSWVEEHDDVFRTPIPEPEALKKSLNGELDHILNLPTVDIENVKEDGSKHLRFNYKNCNKCNNLSTLDFDLVHFTVNNKGERVENEEDLSKVFVLNTGQSEMIKSRMQ